MSLTGAHHAFVSAHEDAWNVIIGAFRASRPYYFSYGSSLLGGGPPPAPASLMSDITIPGLGVSFPMRIDVSALRIDFFPANEGSGLPPELAPLEKDEFAVEAHVDLIVLCPGRRRRPEQPTLAAFPLFSYEPLKASLAVWAVGSPTATPTGGGATILGLTARAIEIVDIEPKDLESILECLLTVILRALLERIRFTLDKITTDFFTLVLADGPHIHDNRLFALGDVL